MQIPNSLICIFEKNVIPLQSKIVTRFRVHFVGIHSSTKNKHYHENKKFTRIFFADHISMFL